jgi:hypothetical protein
VPVLVIRLQSAPGSTFVTGSSNRANRVLRNGTFRLHNKGRFSGEELLLVRIPGPHPINDKEQPISVYRRALWTLFGSLAALELRTDRLKSMALPLLGGTRGYEIKDLMRAILEQSLSWLKAARFMNAVNFYLIDRPRIDEWALPMDDVLGRKFRSALRACTQCQANRPSRESEQCD